MASPLIQTSLTAGEISPALWGQVDLRKYQTGSKLSRNMLVDFRGGQFSRPGTALAAEGLPQWGESPPVLLPFVFNQDQAYVLELSQSTNHGKKMRVIYRGEPVRQTPLVVASVTAANPAVVTITGSAYAPNDFVYFDFATGLARANGTNALNGRTFEIVTAAGTAVTMRNPTTLEMFRADNLTAYVTGATAARELMVAQPWDGTDLYELKYAQSADVMTVCHKDYVIYEISRLAHDNWTITAATIGSSLAQTSFQAAYPVNNNFSQQQFFYAYTVSSFNTRTGQESAVGINAATCQNRALNQTTGVVNTLQWNAVDGADLYRIYKSQPIPLGTQGAPPYFWGLAGQTATQTWTDANFEPDFSIAPPTNDDPFTTGVVTAVVTSNNGFGYINPVVILTDSSGEGATFNATVDSAGAIDPPITVLTGGANYSSAPITSIQEDRATYTNGSGMSIAFSDTWTAVNPGVSYQPAAGSITITVGGSGFHVPRIQYTYAGGGETSFEPGLLYATTTAAVASGLTHITIGTAQAPAAPSGGTMTFTIEDFPADSFDYSRAAAGATITPVVTDNPSCVSYFQQRRVYAASIANPATFWMSRPGQYHNFDRSYPVQSDDAITATLAAGEVNTINSLTPMTTGLVALTSGGAFLISGDGKSTPITPATVNAKPQTFAGATTLQPVRIAEQLIYQQAQGTSVRDLTYDFFTDVYKGADLSVLSDHLFTGRTIKQWAYAAEPHKIVWAVRDDGIMLSMTYLKEQEVVGWTHCDTSGQFVSVCSIPEPGISAVYVVVRRWLEEWGYKYFTERLVPRDFGGNAAMNIPSNPERVWCVDCGARLSPTEPNALLVATTVEEGVLGTPTVVVGGSGYTGTVVTQVLDPTGTGGQITCTATAGVITSAVLDDAGAGYTNPQVLVGTESGGTGAVVSVPTQTIITFEVNPAFLSGAYVGYVLRVAGGKGTVISVPNSSTMRVRMDQPVAGRVPNLEALVLPPAVAGTWSLTAASTAIAGLDHLNGNTVQIVADGSVVEPQVVDDGCITLDVAASIVTAGRGYTCQFQSLRPDAGTPTIQGRRKNVSTVTVRVVDTRGAQIGTDFEDMVEIKQREDEDYGQPIVFQIGGGTLEPLYEGAPVGMNPLGYQDFLTNVDGGWNTEGNFALMQSYPMPLQILAYISEITVGDTPG